MRKQSLLNLTALLFSIVLLVSSCSKDDDSPKPAPQLSGDKTSFNLIPGGADNLTLVVVAPGKLSDVTAVADKGTVTVTEITGKETEAGSAKINYTAPDEVGNFKITVT